MVYISNIPQPTDNPGTQSQPQFLENFTQLNTQFSVDHIALTAGANNGRHTKVTLNAVLGADPNLASPVVSLYSKTVAGASELFFQNGNAAANVKQISNVTATVAGLLKSLRDVSGMLYTWGEVSFANGSATTAVTNFPIAYTDVSLTATPINSTASTIAINAIAGANFQLRRSNTAGALSVKVIAIGR